MDTLSGKQVIACRPIRVLILANGLMAVNRDLIFWHVKSAEVGNLAWNLGRICITMLGSEMKREEKSKDIRGGGAEVLSWTALGVCFMMCTY